MPKNSSVRIFGTLMLTSLTDNLAINTFLAFPSETCLGKIR